MHRIGNVLSDEEAWGDRDLRPETVVAASRCLRLENGGWKVVEILKGMVVSSIDRSTYPGQDDQSDDEYAGDQVRVMPDNAYPNADPYSSLHPVTLKIDPHEALIQSEGGDTYIVTARWVLHHLSANHTGDV
jgi:hypothetical protein